MKQIPLTQGAVALVDDGDYARLITIGNWSLSNRGYAVHYSKPKNLYMHRLLLAAPPHLQVDHIDRDKCNNQRHNLRFATRSENQANKGVQVNNSSGYKGVTFHHGKWQARIRYQGQRIHLGRFESAKEAALIYDAASRALYGDFAGLNLPLSPTPPELQKRLTKRLSARNILCR